MKFNLPPFLRDKRLLAVAGVGAIAGVVVLARGRGGSSSSGGNGATAAGDGSGAAVGTYDTAASDISSALGSFSAQQQQAMENFRQQLSDGLDSMTTKLQQTPITTPPATTTPPAKIPATSSSSAGSLSAHQLHLLHLQHVANTAPKSTTTPSASTKFAGKTVAKAAPAKAAAKPATKTVTVQKGQTLSAIAKANRTTVASLTKLNSLRDPNKIVAGQKLKIG